MIFKQNNILLTGRKNRWSKKLCDIIFWQNDDIFFSENGLNGFQNDDLIMLSKYSAYQLIVTIIFSKNRNDLNNF